MSDLLLAVANDDITVAYDTVENVLSMHGPRLTGDVLAELHKAKDALFRARLATDGTTDALVARSDANALDALTRALDR